MVGEPEARITLSADVSKAISQIERFGMAVDKLSTKNLTKSLEGVEKKVGDFSKKIGGFGKKIGQLGGKMSMFGWRIGLMGLIMMFAGQQIIRMLQGVMKTATQFLTEMADMRGGLKKVTDDLVRMAIGGQLGASSLFLIEGNLNKVVGVVPKAEGEIAKINQSIYGIKLVILEAALPYLQKLADAFESLAGDEKFKKFISELTTSVTEKVVPALISLIEKLKDPDVQDKLKKLAKFFGDLIDKFIEGIPSVLDLVDALDKFKDPIDWLIDKLPLLTGIFFTLFLPLYLLGPVLQLAGTGLSALGGALGIFGTEKIPGAVSGIDKLKGGFGTLITALASPIAWAGIAVIGIALAAYFVSQGENIESFNKKARDLFNGVDKAVSDGIRDLMKVLDNFTDADLGNFIIQTLAIFGRMVVLVLAIFGRLLMGIGEVMVRIIWKVLTGFGKMILDSLAAIAKWVDDLLLPVKEFYQNISDEVGKIKDKVIGLFQDMIDWVLGIFSGWRVDLLAAVTGSSNDILGKVKWVTDAIHTAFDRMVDFVLELWDSLIGGIDWAAGEIKKIQKGLTEGVIKLWEDFKGGLLWIWEGIWGGIKGYINFIIGGINSLISALNSLKFKFPDWIPFMGGKEFGISIPLIPQLKDGGIINTPTIAMLGEAGPEAVVPLNRGGIGGAGVVQIIFPNLTGEISDAQIERIRKVVATEFRSRSRVVR